MAEQDNEETLVRAITKAIQEYFGKKNGYEEDGRARASGDEIIYALAVHLAITMGGIQNELHKVALKRQFVNVFEAALDKISENGMGIETHIMQ